MRWEEPHHPGPGLQLAATVPHFLPLCNTITSCNPICAQPSEAAEQDVGVGDQRGGDHQEDRGDEDEGDDELDLWGGAGGALLDAAALVAAQGAGLTAELLRERRAEAPRALDRRAERRRLLARNA